MVPVREGALVEELQRSIAGFHVFYSQVEIG